MKNPALLFALAAVVILGALLIVFKPDAPMTAPEPVTEVQTSTPEVPAASIAATVAPAATTVQWRIEKGRLVSGPPVLRVTQGSLLNLSFVSDRRDEVHIHGYDLSRKLEAGVPATLEFSASHSGRFELELHHADVEFTVLEVLPP